MTADAPGPAGFGLLNGQPVGPVLPPPVPCEGCGADVWCTAEAQAWRDGHAQPVTLRGVFERDRLVELTTGHAWALSPHVCPLGPHVPLVRVTDFLADDDAQG